MRKIRQSSPSQNITLLAGMIIAGGKRLYNIDRLTHDKSIRDDLFLVGQKDGERAELLLRLNELLLEKLQLKSITVVPIVGIPPLMLMDTQEAAEKGYCPEEPCPDQSGKTCLCNTHCAKNISDFLKSLIERFTQAGLDILLRMDAGFYSDELLFLLESHPIVSYQIGMLQHGWLKRIQTLRYKSYYDR